MSYKLPRLCISLFLATALNLYIPLPHNLDVMIPQNGIRNVSLDIKMQKLRHVLSQALEWERWSYILIVFGLFKFCLFKKLLCFRLDQQMLSWREFFYTSGMIRCYDKSPQSQMYWHAPHWISPLREVPDDYISSERIGASDELHVAEFLARLAHAAVVPSYLGPVLGPQHPLLELQSRFFVVDC